MTNHRRVALLGLAGLGSVIALGVELGARRQRRAAQQLGAATTDAALVEAGARLLGFGGPTVAVVIPAYEEADAIGAVLAAMPREACGYRVMPIVVVDGGEDDTEAVARANGGLVVRHPQNAGHGAALRTGFAAALRCEADVVVVMDADGQHRPDELERLVAPIASGEADHVQGSRFLGEYDDARSPRHVGIVVLTPVVNFLSGARVTDCTTGYRAFRSSALAQLTLEEPRFPVAEIIVESSRRGLVIREVPVHIRSRSHGESKKPPHLAYPLGYLGAVGRAVWRTRASVVGRPEPTGRPSPAETHWGATSIGQ